MKKFLAVLLALTMVIGTGIMVSAVEGGPSVTFIKKVEGGGNPEETFSFTIGKGNVIEGSADSAPVFNPSTFTIKVGKGEGEGTKIVNLPTFSKVGRYEYEITETEGTTAGMTYDRTARTLVVIVTNKDVGGFDYTVGMKTSDGKSDDFTVANNTYASGDLMVKKVLEGNLADPDDEFQIKVTLSLPEGSELDFKTDGIDWGDGVLAGDGKSATYTLKGGENFTIQNIPEGVTYKVEELNAGEFKPKYDVSYSNETGTMTENGATATITNTRGTDIETGISLDNLPYIMTMVLALAGLVLFVVRKRRFN